jgi:type I restriction enzyme R subunit
MSGEAREQFANYIPDGDIGKFASELRDRVNRDFTATIKLYVI